MNPLLKVDGVTVRFGGLTAIDNVSFEVHEGELLGLIGPNGAGKTTMLRSITGVVRVTEGKVERVVNLPVPRPTSCVFGGADLQTLFVTTARIRLSAAQLTEAPLSGSIFSIDTGIKGLPENIFGG